MQHSIPIVKVAIKRSWDLSEGIIVKQNNQLVWRVVGAPCVVLCEGWGGAGEGCRGYLRSVTIDPTPWTPTGAKPTERYTDWVAVAKTCCNSVIHCQCHCARASGNCNISKQHFLFGLHRVDEIDSCEWIELITILFLMDYFSFVLLPIAEFPVWRIYCECDFVSPVINHKKIFCQR